MGRDRSRWWIPVLTGLLVAGGLTASCSNRPRSEIEVEVSRVAVDPASHSPVVVLEDKKHTVVLPIWIGPAEARAIAMELEGIESPRPMTHDLMKNVLDEVGVCLQRVVIGELRENTYFARIVFLWRGEEMEIDSRPSDAIALAVRFGQPIFVATALLEKRKAIALREVDGSSTITFGGVTVQVVSVELAEHFHIPPGGGVLVSDVGSGVAGPLRRGDVILEVDGRPVHNLADFGNTVRTLVGRAEFSVQRGGDRIRIAFDTPATDSTE